MAGKDLTYNLKLLTDQAQKSAKALGTEIGKVNDQLEDDSRTAAQKMADALNAAATDVQADLDRVAQTAEALRMKLGPEFEASTGKSAESIVIEFRKAGLELEDVEAHAEQLADAIKRVETTSSNVDAVTGKVRGLGSTARGVGEDFDHVSARADNTRSVVANFAGNATQELPGVAGAMGPMNMALGQFAEYASEGNIKLKSLVLAGAGLGAAAFVMGKLADNAERVAETKAWRREQLDGFVGALREGEDAAEALAERLRDAGEIKLDIGGMLGIDSIAPSDVTPALAAIGITIDQIATAATEGKPGLDGLRDVLGEVGATTEQTNLVMAIAEEQARFYAEAQKVAAAQVKVFGDESEEAARKNNSNKQAMEHAGLAAQEANRRGIGPLKLGLDDLKRIADENKTSFEDLRGVLDDEEAWDRTEGNVADLKVALMEAFDAGKKGSEDAALKTEAYTDQLRITKQGVIDYGEQIGLLPSQVETLLTLLDNGQIAEMEAELTHLMRAREAKLTLIAAGKPVGASGSYGGARAAGGPVSAGTPYLVGEQGPELVVPGQSGMVIPAGRTSSLLSGGGGGVIHIHTGADPNSVIRIIKDYQRKGGRL